MAMIIKKLGITTRGVWESIKRRLYELSMQDSDISVVGIGTYVKASRETSDNVGDKTNEFCRVSGNDLR